MKGLPSININIKRDIFVKDYTIKKREREKREIKQQRSNRFL